MDLLRQRRDLKLQMIDSDSANELALVETELQQASKASRNIRRHLAAVRLEALTEELWDNWRLRRMAECHRILRSMAFKKTGPKQRKFSALRTSMPRRSEWLSVWQLPGFEGGMEAVEAEWDSMLSEHITCAPELPPNDMNFLSLAKRDVQRLKEHCVHAAKRKSAPAFSIPTAVLTMVLAPSWRMNSPAAKKALGLGAEVHDHLRTPWTKRALFLGYGHVNRTMFTPLKWHFSLGAALNKGNN